ncbi:MAG: hypothetical protein KAS62_04890, partial [Candidatus Delongbacteria bacterium]|nr:hypothetical protein [Candidatus Delongbacteria bacterium]
KFKADYDKNLIGILSDTDLKFSKGINTLEISLARSENFEQEIMLYRPVGKSKINQLYITVKSSGFETAIADEEPVEDDPMLDSMGVAEDEGYDTDEYLVSEADGLDVDEGESSSGTSFMSTIIMGIMAVVILILIVLLFVGRKGGLYEKYETFFDDVASIVNVEAKGNNFDKVIEEIMMILLDKFETQYGKEQEPEKKPAPKKADTLNTIKTSTPEPITPEPVDEDLDLDFGKSDDKPTEDEEKPKAKKLELDNGFDFSDDDKGKEDAK